MISEERKLYEDIYKAKRQADVEKAQCLKDLGYSNQAIGKSMGLPESSVRHLLKG